MADRMKIWIADAMKKLMAKQSLDKIRVTQICKEAQIERPTFYYHFKDKYDLVAWIFLRSALETDVTSFEASVQAMNNMRKEVLFYRRAYEDLTQNALWKYMLEFFVEQHTKKAKLILNTDILDPQIAFSIRMYCYGTVSMSREWLLDDNITPAETIVEMMFNSMPENLKKIYFQ